MTITALPHLGLSHNLFFSVSFFSIRTTKFHLYNLIYLQLMILLQVLLNQVTLFNFFRLLGIVSPFLFEYSIYSILLKKRKRKETCLQNFRGVDIKKKREAQREKYIKNSDESRGSLCVTVSQLGTRPCFDSEPLNDMWEAPCCPLLRKHKIRCPYLIHDGSHLPGLKRVQHTTAVGVKRAKRTERQSSFSRLNTN